MESGQYQENDQGVQQGGPLSPLLFNIYLHYILDIWFEKVIKPKAKGYVQLIRYCDDFVVCCESENDARALLEQLKKRFEKFGLSVADEKTRVFKFGRQEWRLAANQGQRSETFNFLGFTHYGRKSRRGYWVMGHKTSKENLSKKLKEITEYVKETRCKAPLKEWWPVLHSKLAGHINYFGISGNFRCLEQFRSGLIMITFKWINRRSQKKSMDWEKFMRFMKFNPLPQPKVCYALY